MSLFDLLAKVLSEELNDIKEGVGIVEEVILEVFPNPEIPSGEGDYTELSRSMRWTDDTESGIDTRQYMLEQASSVSVTRDSSGNIISGFWTDPHTGYASSDPADFDIDHRVPFKQVATEFPDVYGMTTEEQLKIYNDPENLQVLHDMHNQVDKGDETLQEHAQEIASVDKRDEFLAAGNAYLGKLGADLRA